MPKSAYVPWLKKKVDSPTAYGIYFQERWDEALAANPEFLYINDWNEWTAGKYHPDHGGTTPWLGRDNPFFFVDQYNAEFNRGIQPMKGGYTDNYYMQMAQNIRRYKGVRPIPEQKGFTSIAIDGSFKDWEKVENEFRDTKGDVWHRDAIGYAGINYVNRSGRNDIITSKVALSKKKIYFYVETSAPLTPHTDKNWMLLLIDADNDSNTGWYGYDFLINGRIESETQTTLMKYEQDKWVEISTLAYRYSDNKMEIEIPIHLLSISQDYLVMDFKWSDNPEKLENPISFALNGDTAPNRRFNYRLKWKK